MIKRLKILNAVSGIAFAFSSVSLLFIPFLNEDNRNYTIAVFFWVGLLTGMCIQIFLKLKCSRMKLVCKTRIQRAFNIAAAVFSILFIVLAITGSKNDYIVTGSLFAAAVSLQTAAIIKRRGCLK